MSHRHFITCTMLFFASALFAQQERSEHPPAHPVADSLQQRVRGDSLEQESRSDSLRTPVARPLRIPAAWWPDSPLNDRLLQTHAPQFHEDLAELLQSLPRSRLFRSGDIGLPAFISMNGLPPRFTEVRFDGILWPEGLYGQTNFTALPDILADRIEWSPGSPQLRFESDPLRGEKPWTHVDYANGPFGVDVMRVRFRRTLSKQITPYLGLSFANSDGQPLSPTDRSPGAFDAMKHYLRFNYALSPHLNLRYRLLSASSEAVSRHAFFPEELPATALQQLKYKETRYLNSLELAKVATLTDSSGSPRAKRDLLRVQIFLWQTSEEFRENARQLLIQHRRTVVGIAAYGRWLRRVLAVHAEVRARQEKFDSPTIDLSPQQRYQLDLTSQVRPSMRMTIDGHIRLLRQTHFGWQAAALVRGALKIDPTLLVYASAGRRFSMPGAAEFANTIPGVLQQSPALRPMQTDQFAIGAVVNRPNLELRSGITHNTDRQALILIPQDSPLHFANDSAQFRTTDLWFAGRWQATPFFELEWRLQHATHLWPAAYSYWYVPRSAHYVAVRFRHTFFENELHAAFAMEFNYIGQRRAPLPGMPGDFSTQKLDGGDFTALALTLDYKDAAIFLRLDNIFRQDLNWRPQQPMRKLTFRYGISWHFWN